MDLYVPQEIERLGHLFIVIHRHDHRFHLIVLEDDDPPPMLSLQIGQHFSEGPRDSRCAEDFFFLVGDGPVLPHG